MRASRRTIIFCTALFAALIAATLIYLTKQKSASSPVAITCAWTVRAHGEMSESVVLTNMTGIPTRKVSASVFYPPSGEILVTIDQPIRPHDRAYRSVTLGASNNGHAPKGIECNVNHVLLADGSKWIAPYRGSFWP
jgi:hypothetical protein